VILQVRKKVEVCTDPQRRCYDGVWASSKWVWTEWSDVYRPRTREDAEDSVRTYREINPQHQYRIIEDANT
jgi:hypothetical protein